jgi:hypothetical protein
MIRTTLALPLVSLEREGARLITPDRVRAPAFFLELPSNQFILNGAT